MAFPYFTDPGQLRSGVGVNVVFPKVYRSLMSNLRRLLVSTVGNVTVVRFVDRKILDDANIPAIAHELNLVAERVGKGPVLLDFANVEFLSSAALGRLISFDKKIVTLGGKLKLCNIRPEIHEVFVITRLNRVFDLHEDEADALAAFAS